MFFLFKKRTANEMRISDWSSDVCSSDLGQNWTRVTDATLGDHHLNAMVRAADGALIVVGERGLMARSADNGDSWQLLPQVYDGSFFGVLALKRSEERRVGKECVSPGSSRWWQCH